MSFGVLKEFPRFPEPLPEIEGFEDTSWHNDACPSIGMELGEDNWLTLFVNYPNPKQREIGDYKYSLFHQKGLDTKMLCTSDNLNKIKKSIHQFLKGA